MQSCLESSCPRVSPSLILECKRASSAPHNTSCDMWDTSKALTTTVLAVRYLPPNNCFGIDPAKRLWPRTTSRKSNDKGIAPDQQMLKVSTQHLKPLDSQDRTQWFP
eukprot:6429132-Amphidinium_carterae.2